MYKGTCNKQYKNSDTYLCTLGGPIRYLGFSKQLCLYTLRLGRLYRQIDREILLPLITYISWQYGLESFQKGDTKLEIFLSKNQHIQRKFFNFENWTNGQPHALSFYRSQNVLCRSKFFEPAQKFDCKNFCAGTKTNFTECKSYFCLAQNVCDWHNMQINFWAGSKNLDRHKTFWDL